MSEEQIKEKVIVFNPGGFILKVIFSLLWALSPFIGSEKFTFLFFLKNILGFAMIFCIFYFIATMFGFSVRATGNYIIGFVVFLVLLCLLVGGLFVVGDYLGKWGFLGEILEYIVMIVIFVWPFVHDVKKAIIYFKNCI